ncbi:ATP-grasp domain-containing protein, partial [Patescibacteria group bacterium]|nr:ATP-grasp domain-containing protein [Patescibacteria group bacterium]
MNQSIGIVGGGQLGRMLTYEAQKLGFFVTILDPTPGSPAGQVADRQIVADFKDADAIRSLASQVDFLTFEIELANAGILEELATAGVTVNPSATTLSIIQDKLRQKQFLRDHGVPVPPFFAIKTRRDIEAAARQYGYPLLIKARFDGYDGRGNAILRSDEGINVVLARLASRELYGEAFIRFEKELAVVVARSEAGDIRNYPVVETVHHHNICHTVFAPAP